ncbi:hypothetical protein BDP81DRAFT_513692 [Colletotrichum phormii]|uniref:NB-ARC domain-containing protein n=1 Tax=Colletotrichum phormii TaxID=359342 RepID=A0AAI9ZBB4_9PEZI|nr:uncharacterized protein BDP81DRAFT_513692 [Colletotrichum phormii]KAK1613488.1 hypothetical protein BDP81DRAFT_513692 [Colletotrichum phormii]
MGITRLLKKFNGRTDRSAVASSTPQPEAPCAPPSRPFGLEVLVEGRDPVVDIVAVHGLNGHREHTWTASGGKHWLRDFLPTDLPNARVLCWGYDANTHSSSSVSIQYLYDHARELVADLTRKRGLTNVCNHLTVVSSGNTDSNQSRERPIIFVVHSLGGIVVKSALIHSDTAREGALAEHRSIKTSTHGILFMGTPHQGGNGVQLGRVLVNVASIFVSADDRLLKHLERESEWLQQQLGQYEPISGDFVTKFAYEVYKTPTPLGQITVVPRASAVVPGQADGEPIAIHADHISMVKFASKEDPSYVKVSEVLQIMVANAGNNIRSRWETEERVTRARIGNETPEKKSGPFYSIPFPDNKGFVGRSETLQALQSILFRDKCQKVALCGLGGIGKTQVALKLAYLTKQEKPDYSIFWVPASSKETFNEAYLAIARKLDVHVTDDEDLRIALREHLSSPDSGKWLLIIDNADDEGVLYESEDGLDRLYDCLPQSDDGVTLFTTRFSRVATSVAGRNVVDLASMSLNEASDFMRQSLVKALYREGIMLKELLEDLTYLPLAIAQAAAYMNENRTSMQEYLGLLRNTKQDMIELLSSDFHDRTRYRDRNSQSPVATTWFISFSKIHECNKQAAELLMFLSYIEPKGIPRSIMPKLSSEQQITAAIGTLCAYAFLTQRGSTKVYDMHRLVHVSTSIWIESQNSKDQKADLALEIWESAVQQVTRVFPSDAHENRYLWKEYMPHALRLLGNELLNSVKKVDLGYRAGRCLKVDGRVKDAIKLLEHVVDVGKTTLDEGHPDRLASQHALAGAYEADGRVKDAIKLLEHVVDVGKTTLDEGHPDRLASQHALAGAYEADGRVKDAIKLLEHVVDVGKTTLDEGHPDRLASQHELARAYQADGRVKDAIKLLEHVVDVGKTTLDEGHPDRLASQHALAGAYEADGRVQDAIKLLEHVVDVEETTLDEGHPSRLASQHALAGAYKADGRVKDAIKLLEHVVDVGKTTLDEGHPDRLASQHALAGAYEADGRVKDAIKLLEHVVDIGKTTLDEGHPSRLASQHELARAYQADGRVKDAIKLLEHVVDVCKTTLDEGHPSRLASQHALAGAYEADGRVKDAIKLLEHVVDVCKTTLDEGHPSRLASQHALAGAYEADGRVKDAIKLLEHVVDVGKTTLDEGHPSRLASQHALAGAYKADGRVKDAIKLLEHVVDVRETTLDEGHPDRLASQHALAGAYEADGRVKDAIKLLEHVVDVCKTTLDEGHPSRLASQHALAGAYEADGRVKDAIKLLEHVVDVRKTTLDEGHPSRLASQHALAGAYEADGRVKDAIKLLEHVVDVRKTTLDEGHPSRLASQHALAGAYEADGRVKDAIKLLEHVVDVRKTTLDEGHPSRLASQHALAGAYQADGRVQDAIKLLEHVVDVEETTLDEGHPSRLASQHALAGAYKADGRVKDAIKLLEHVVDVGKTTLDEGHPDRLASQHELAGAYEADGRVKDAIKLLEHVVDVRKTTLDEGHPSRLASQHELAGAYQADGRVKDAIKLLEHVVDIGKTTLDEGHPSRLASQHALAGAYEAAEAANEILN